MMGFLRGSHERAGIDVGELGSGTWDEVVDAITARHPTVRVGKMFGMPCLKRADGKVAAALWRDGGIAVKLVVETEREEALGLPGAHIATHAFDPQRRMREWVHVPARQAVEWEHLVERALGTWT